jgi:thioredoxin 1
MRKLATALVAVFSAAAFAAAGPYDEAADARQDVKAALAAAGATGKQVLVVFGANWCPDCRVLDSTLKEGASAALMDRHYTAVKVDVGKFDKNTDLAASYGVPLKKGIPAVAVLSPQGRVVYVTQAGELADARGMGGAGIHAFFAKVAAPPAK